MWTQGHLIGEVIRRISGQSFGEFFRHKVAERVGSDFHIGITPTDFPRIAAVVAAPEPPTWPDLSPDSVAGRVFDIGFEISPELVGSPAWRKADMLPANGHGNARSVVRAQTALANRGRAFGVDLLSERGALAAASLQMEAVDLVLGVSMKYAMGYGMLSADVAASPNKNALFWGGCRGIHHTARSGSSFVSFLRNESAGQLRFWPEGAAVDQCSLCCTK
jgi:CubicO group peptidase (beta-lactamase class C family)